MSEHLVDDFAQVTPLEYFHHRSIECLINCINSNDISIPILDLYLESNPGGCLNLHQTHTLNFFGLQVSYTSSDLSKEGFHIHLTHSIDLKTPISPLKACSNSYRSNKSSGGGGEVSWVWRPGSNRLCRHGVVPKDSDRPSLSQPGIAPQSMLSCERSELYHP